MRNRKNVSSSVEQTAAAVEPMAPVASDPTTRSFQAAASAIGPGVFPTERWRKDTKEAMLREFNRPRGEARADAGSQDGLETISTNVVRVETGTCTVTLADMEPISAEQAEAATHTLQRIVARHESRTHLS